MPRLAAEDALVKIGAPSVAPLFSYSRRQRLLCQEKGHTDPERDERGVILRL